jgi:hypothetical protein
MERKMNWNISVTIILAVAGWIVYHYLTSQRDIAQKRREIITNHLIEAYRELDYFAKWLLLINKGTSTPAEVINSTSPPRSYPRNKGASFPTEAINRAIADIQLFGSLKQIKLARDFSEKMVSGDLTSVIELNSIIHDLRDSLRSELKLPETKEKIAFLNMTSITRDK